jgi:hypothetical protein
VTVKNLTAHLGNRRATPQSQPLAGYEKEMVKGPAGHSSLGLPDDKLCLGIAGFDASAPQLVSNFVAGRF